MSMEALFGEEKLSGVPLLCMDGKAFAKAETPRCSQIFSSLDLDPLDTNSDATGDTDTPRNCPSEASTSIMSMSSSPVPWEENFIKRGKQISRRASDASFIPKAWEHDQEKENKLTRKERSATTGLPRRKMRRIFSEILNVQNAQIEFEFPSEDRRKPRKRVLRRNAKVEKCPASRLVRSVSDMSSATQIPRNEDRPEKSSVNVLPTIKTCHEGIQAISVKTVAELVEGKYQKQFDKVLVLDTRFPFEFEGGHIRGARSVLTPEALDELLFGDVSNMVINERTCIIVHCEFSANRGPRACRYIRRKDRDLNGVSGFPNLYYPSLYLMKDGYKEFFAKFPRLCEPQAHVTMNGKEHIKECRRWVKETRKRWQKLRRRGRRINN